MDQAEALIRSIQERDMGSGDTLGTVYDFSGTRIGTADAAGVVTDNAGIRMGTVAGDGEVFDYSGRHIGKVSGSEPDRHRHLIGAAASA